MKPVYLFSALFLGIAVSVQAVELNTEALKTMQEEGHKILEEAEAGRSYTIGKQCLDTEGGALLIRPCKADNASQLWRMDDKKRLVAHDGRCIAGAKLQRCAQGPAQLWQHDGKQRLKNEARRCLQVKGNPAKPGARVVLAKCSNHKNQVWK